MPILISIKCNTSYAREKALLLSLHPGFCVPCLCCVFAFALFLHCLRKIAHTALACIALDGNQASVFINGNEEDKELTNMRRMTSCPLQSD